MLFCQISLNTEKVMDALQKRQIPVADFEALAMTILYQPSVTPQQLSSLGVPTADVEWLCETLRVQ